MNYRYEVSYESSGFSGSLFVLAATESEALAKFADDWSEAGDPVPSCWISGRWVIS